MNNNNASKINSAFVALRSETKNESGSEYLLVLKGRKSLFESVNEGSWVLVVDTRNEVLGVGRVYRQRHDLESTILFFDKYQKADSPTTSPFPVSGQISRLEWTKFAEGLPNLFGKTLAEIPLIQDDVHDV